MRANQSRPGDEGGGARDRGGRLELFFYERRGDRYYLRLTGLAVGLIVGLTAVSIAAIIFIFLFRGSRGGVDNVNINVVAPSPSPPPANTPLIKMPPPPSPPKVYHPQPVVAPTPPNPPAPGANANGRPGPTSTPRHDASKPPP